MHVDLVMTSMSMFTTEQALTSAVNKPDLSKVSKESQESQDLNHHSQPTVVFSIAQPQSPTSKLLLSVQRFSEEEAHGSLLLEDQTTEELNFSVFLATLITHVQSKKKCQFL